MSLGSLHALYIPAINLVYSQGKAIWLFGGIFKSCRGELSSLEGKIKEHPKMYQIPSPTEKLPQPPLQFNGVLTRTLSRALVPLMALTQRRSLPASHIHTADVIGT